MAMPEAGSGRPLDRDRARQFATEVVTRLQGSGFQALWAGGCVRDLILGEEPSDFDVATDARPEQVMRIFRRHVPVGASFGVVRVLGPSGLDVEVATFRADGEYRDGRRPESVEFADARRDAERRDFTINGMFLDPLGGEILDFVGGRADLDARVIRAIGDPAARFNEDKLRLLRAVRFAARFGGTIEPATARAVAAMADQVTVVAAERIAQELRKMLAHPTRAGAMALALDAGLLAQILPPVARLRGIPAHAPAFPGDDLWDHTRRVLALLPARSGFELALAALLHEVGRVDPGAEGDDHERTGRKVAETLGRALKLANVEREHVAWLVGSHRALVDPARLTTSQVKRQLAAPGIDDLLALHRADGLATRGEAENVEYCEAYRRDEPAGPIAPPPLLSGHDLGRHGFRPGPRFKELLDVAYDAQLDGLVATKDEALAWLDRRDAEIRRAAQDGTSTA